jgi:hypothetical protein
MGAAAPPVRVPVVVELFTSEGCEDCPPADLVLKSLASQPVDGAEILILGEHVDYFNHDGWTDRFSSAAFTERQEAYDRAPNSHTPFTPEMIVDGSAHFVGSDRSAALAAVRRAATRAKPALDLKWAPAGTVDIAFDAPAAAGAEVVVAVTEDGLSTEVRGGENRGRTLVHDGVVRRLSVAGRADGRGRFQKSVALKIDPAWRGPRRLVVIVQREGGAVIAAGLVPGGPGVPGRS